MDRSNSLPSTPFLHHPARFPALPHRASIDRRRRRSATSTRTVRPPPSTAHHPQSYALLPPTSSLPGRVTPAQRGTPVSGLPASAIRGKKAPVRILLRPPFGSSFLASIDPQVHPHHEDSSPVPSVSEFSIARLLSPPPDPDFHQPRPRQRCASTANLSPPPSRPASFLEPDEHKAADVVEEPELVESEDMATLGSSPGDARRGVVSPRPKGRENARNTVCRNIGIYGHCRYQNEGCLYNHETAASKTSLTPAFENRLVMCPPMSISSTQTDCASSGV
jgi:hypothetical protein